MAKHFLIKIYFNIKTHTNNKIFGLLLFSKQLIIDVNTLLLLLLQESQDWKTGRNFLNVNYMHIQVNQMHSDNLSSEMVNTINDRMTQ